MNNTLFKGLQLMEILANHGGEIGLGELAAAAKMPKSSAHRLLQALVEANYVSRRNSGTYLPTIKLWKLASATLNGFDLLQHARPIMNDLMTTLGESVHLSVLDRREVVCVHKVDIADPIRDHSQIGGRAPAHCAATGKAIVAFRSMQWLAQANGPLHRATARTITDSTLFEEEMRRIRAAGHAVTVGEWRIHVNGIAAPIFDDTGAAIAAIGITGPDSRLPRSRIADLAPQIGEAAMALSMCISSIAPHTSLQMVTARWAERQ